MKIARVAVLGVALGAGAIAALLALNMRAPAPPKQTAAAPVATTKTVQVLVASKDIPMGSTVTEGDVDWQDWPQSGASNTNFVVRSSDGGDPLKNVVGAVARASFFSGEPISESKLITTDRGFMSAILPAGKRAVATSISAVTSAGGFILPNDRVDVIMTRQGQNGGFDTETILNNIRVLAIDQTIEEVDGKKVVVGQTATLELTPQQAEILSVAQQMSSQLTLALRSIRDADAPPLEADAFHLIGGSSPNSGVVTMVKNGIVKEVTGIR